jgi:hypothetical protein
MAHTPDNAAVLAIWDNGEVAAELSDDETVAAIAKSLKSTEAAVRAVLVAAGRIEEATP